MRRFPPVHRMLITAWKRDRRANAVVGHVQHFRRPRTFPGVASAAALGIAGTAAAHANFQPSKRLQNVSLPKAYGIHWIHRMAKAHAKHSETKRAASPSWRWE